MLGSLEKESTLIQWKFDNITAFRNVEYKRDLKEELFGF